MPDSFYTIVPYVNPYYSVETSPTWTGHFGTWAVINRATTYFDVFYYFADQGGRNIGEMSFVVFYSSLANV